MTSPMPRPIKISVIIPVFNHARFLESAILSAVSQTCPDIEVIIHDDCSTDPEVRDILRRFRGTPKVKLSWSKVNEGISMATNRAILQSTGDYLAFLDCDDMLPPSALETAVNYIKLNPHTRYFYSNREDIDDRGRVISRLDLHRYSFKNPGEELIRFMFAGHLKIIKKEAFREAGLFKKDFDSCQDYDLALRMSERFSFCHIPEYLYQYRIHPGQISQVKKREQSLLAYRARDVAAVRRRIFKGDIGRKKISVIMLTMNRWQRTKKTLDQLVRNTTLPFELIILDNNSLDDTANYLQWFAKQFRNVHLIMENLNLGCSGGRKKALDRAGGDFIVMLDNDIRVTPLWLENLLARLKETRADAACCKVVTPDGKIQYNGGSYRISDPFITFSFVDNSLPHDDLGAMIDRDCDWLPGGATIYRRPVFDRVAFCQELFGGLEDKDLSLQMKRAGLRMVNCPASMVIHHHASFEAGEMKDPVYMQQRYDWERLKKTVLSFYRRHRLIVYDPWLFERLDIPRGSTQETKKYFLEMARPRQSAGESTGGNGPGGGS